MAIKSIISMIILATMALNSQAMSLGGSNDLVGGLLGGNNCGQPAPICAPPPPVVPICAPQPLPVNPCCPQPTCRQLPSFDKTEILNALSNKVGAKVGVVMAKLNVLRAKAQLAMAAKRTKWQKLSSLPSYLPAIPSFNNNCCQVVTPTCIDPCAAVGIQSGPPTPIAAPLPVPLPTPVVEKPVLLGKPHHV